MLRHLKVENFVFFKEEHSVDFQPGSNFFIGQNNSGKSSIIEAVRRCMSTSKNTSFSRPFDASVPSTAVVFFDVPDNDNSRLVTFIIRMPTSKDSVPVPVGVKVVYFEDKICETFQMDMVRSDPNRGLANRQIILDDVESQMIYKNIPSSRAENRDRFSKRLTDAILQKFVINKLKTFANENIPDGNTMVLKTECEKMLTKYVDKYTVFMFGVRGVGSLQWSNSKKVCNKRRKMNSDEAQEHAEILNWYFDHPEEVDKEQEKRYFDIITNNSQVEFERANENITMINRLAGKGNQEELALFKVPNGLFEAKNCAIILSMKMVQTVGSEEPERGMHPQMIERLRDLILQRITNKTIILSSHHPAILAPWTVPRIHFFCRKETEHEHTFEIIPGSVIGQCEGEKTIERKTPRIVTSAHFSSIVFAQRVLLLEGETDFLFMTSIKTLLLENVEMTKRLIELKEHFVDANATHSDTFLCSLHIVDMRGNENKKRMVNICKALHLEYYLLLDFDAILSEQPKHLEQKGKAIAADSTPRTADKFLEDMSLSGKYTASKVKENVRVLEKERIFIWEKSTDDEKGELEDVIIALCENSADRKAFLKKNNVNFTFERQTSSSNRQTLASDQKAPASKKTKPKKKLFGDPQVTRENITNVARKLIEYDVEDWESGKTKPTERRGQQILRLVWFLYEHAKSNM